VVVHIKARGIAVNVKKARVNDSGIGSCILLVGVANHYALSNLVGGVYKANVLNAAVIAVSGVNGYIQALKAGEKSFLIAAHQPLVKVIIVGELHVNANGVHVEICRAYYCAIGYAVGKVAITVVRGGVVNGGNFTMNGGEISDNTAVDVGGGVWCSLDNLTINSGKISGNYADYGGGIYVQEGSNCIFNNGIISGNGAEEGGGVNIDGTFRINGGSISGNTALIYGGGVLVDNGKFQMSGGIIYGYYALETLKNTAEYNVTAALYNSHGTAQYGRLNGNSFTPVGNLNKYNADTIKVVNGNLFTE